MILPGIPSSWPFSLFTRAWLLAMLDRFDEAVPLARDSNERLRELDGRRIGEIRLAEIARMAGDHQAAAGHPQTLCAWLEEREQYGLLATYVSLLGRELCALGRFDEAEALARRGRELAADDNIDSSLWRQVQARVLAHRGEHSEAERLAREAVARVEESDNLRWQGDAWCELAEVLEAAGRRDRRLARGARPLRAQGDHPARAPRPRKTRSGSTDASLRTPNAVPERLRVSQSVP